MSHRRKHKEAITMDATMKTPTKSVLFTEAPKDAPNPRPVVDRQTLIDGLNQDLAGEYQAILMYIHYSAKLTGPFRRELRAFFQAEIADEQAHAQFLSDKIAAMGGEPTTESRPVPHVNHARQMLDCALSAEVQAIAAYSTRICQAEACGEIGLKVELENQLADETRHKEEIERIIAGWYEVYPERDLKENRLQDIGGQG
jgi:bacterioferritin